MLSIVLSGTIQMLLILLLWNLSHPAHSLIFSNESQLLGCSNLTLSEAPLCSTIQKNSTNIGLNSKDSNSQTVERKNFSSAQLVQREANYNSIDCSQDGLSKNSSGSWRTSLVCAPLANNYDDVYSPQSQPTDKRPLGLVFIRALPEDASRFPIGSSVTIQCRFNALKLDQDIKFKLRWLRSVAESPGTNQSITSTDTDSSSTLIAATTRVWTVQRSGGLDLELNDFQLSDSGNYFCQAIDPDSSSIISEASIQISAIEHKLKPSRPDENAVGAALGLDTEKGQETETETTTQVAANETLYLESNKYFRMYSRENLAKLLPSLTVIPSFSEVSLGDTIQLSCVTSELDPDPEPSEIEWTFEPIDRTRLMLSKPPAFGRAYGAGQLPPNVSKSDSALVVWSMSEEHVGLYKCSFKMTEFNLSAEAVGELALRPNSDSAPLVYVTPEFVRLSPNGSATIRCVSTGYPAPKLIWYRVDTLPGSKSSNETNELDLELSVQMEGIGIEKVDYKDAAIYCEQLKQLQGFKCLPDSVSRQFGATGFSLIHLHRAQANHQGTYVCRANNERGSNQAHSIVDVEFKEKPIVAIATSETPREQTILLPDTLSSTSIVGAQNVTFKCSIEAGRPMPRLRWLRTSSNGNLNTVTGTGSNNNNKDLDIYDLTRVSSATSNVNTWTEDNGKSLVLSINTISLDDEGDYVCVGENELAHHSAVARLNVRKPANVRIVQSSPMLARINDSFHLDCIASGHPIPLDIEWSRSDRGAFFSLISRNTNLQGGQERAVLKFDRVSADESGEYTCNTRDPLNPSTVLRDTIMVLVEDATKSELANSSWLRAQNSLLPKLMVRPTKVNAPAGSDVTLDCLAVSGLQPTIVEWTGPPQLMAEQSSQLIGSNNNNNSSVSSQQLLASSGRIAYPHIRPYYRGGSTSGQLLQFGSKLKIFNLSKLHEGVYQCKGRNRMGIENAPALIKLLDADSEDQQLSPFNDDQMIVDPSVDYLKHNGSASSDNSLNLQQTKTKVAKLGSNIELKCQVNGIEQPTTSWSRDGLELPASSMQIEHNLWIQNVTSNDGGLYVCSARAKQPNKVLQAKINLLVREDLDLGSQFRNLSAKIVASKSNVNVGDSITLECIVSQPNVSSSNQQQQQQLVSRLRPVDLEEIERNVVWTNLNSGQSLFQDNVYMQNNLLIIYELRAENSAIYRCNYNDLTQHSDYKLQVDSANGAAISSSLHPDRPMGAGSTTNVSSGSSSNSSLSPFEQTSDNGLGFELRRVSLGSRLRIECPLTGQEKASRNSPSNYFWTRGDKGELLSAKASSPLQFDSVETSDGDIYYCHRGNKSLSADRARPRPQMVTSVMVHVTVPVARFVQKPVSFISLPAISGADHQLDIELKFLPERENGLILFSGQQHFQIGASAKVAASGDYFTLGLNRAHVEFKFELGDGPTLLRSLQPVSMNHWHRLLVQRDRREALMLLDKQPKVSNSTTGKFFNLNLDSILFVGGAEYFMLKHGRNQSHSSNLNSTSNSTGDQNYRLHGYSRGFQGCISLLRVSRNKFNLMSHTERQAALGIYECNKPECKLTDCNQRTSVCQVDEHSESRTSEADHRCLCLPGFTGLQCDERTVDLSNSSFVATTFNESQPTQSATNSNRASVANKSFSSMVAALVTKSELPTPIKQGACEQLNPCSGNGTLECSSLTSTSFKCHCQLGFIGETCSQVALFSSETKVSFNQQAYLQFRFNSPEEMQQQQQSTQQKLSQANSERTPERSNLSQQTQLDAQPTSSTFNASNFAKLSSMSEHQNITFKLRTKSSYGLIFYNGLAWNLSAGRANSSGHQISSIPSPSQTSKSMVANLLARLSNSVADYLAIALVDGHLELSYELGSGVAIIRSSQRINDDQEHKIGVTRNGKTARLTIDDLHKHDGSSPGKLSMLNSQPDIYLGGLAHSNELTNNIYLSGFVGCIGDLEINTLGPLNLIRSNPLSQIRAARNLAPCAGPVQPQPQPQPQQSGTTNQRHKPYQSPPSADSDESDEM